MRRWIAACAMVVLGSAALRADVTVTSTTTIEGPAAGMMGGASPRMVMRIKGRQSRADVEVMGRTMSSLTDLDKKEVILLHPEDKTARVITGAAPEKPGAPPPAAPQVDASFAPTGKSQTIDGVSCDEFAFTMRMPMRDMMGAQMAPQAAEMFKDMQMVMKGSVWIAKSAPGAAEYVAFQKAAAEANLAAVLSGSMPGAPASGMDRVMKGLSTAEGIPYLLEMNMSMEGAGPAGEMMQQAGGMNMKMTSRVTSISTDPIAADLLTVPPDYKIVR